MQSFFLIQCNVPHRDKSRCVLTSGNVTADWCRFDTKIYYFIDSESWCLFPQLSSIMIVSSNLQTTDLFRVAIPSSIERNSTYNDLFRTWSIDEWRIIMHHESLACVIQNSPSQIWNAFHTILLKSPTMKFYIREIFFDKHYLLWFYYDKPQVEMDNKIHIHVLWS